jgi:hypothetical protein
MNTLTDRQIENLHHCRARSFLNEQVERFEVMERSPTDDGDWSDGGAQMRWYGNQVEALFAFNYFARRHKVRLLFDTAGGALDTHCLCIDLPIDLPEAA